MAEADEPGNVALAAFWQIRGFTLRGDLVGGEACISALSQQTRRHPHVVVAVTCFYHTLGFHARAEDTVIKSPYRDRLHDPRCLLDEVTACLAILFAIQQFLYHCDYDEAMNVYRVIELIWIKHDFDTIPEPSQHERDLAVAIESQAKLWTSSTPDSYDDSSAPISDMRV